MVGFVVDGSFGYVAEAVGAVVVLAGGAGCVFGVVFVGGAVAVGAFRDCVSGDCSSFTWSSGKDVACGSAGVSDSGFVAFGGGDVFGWVGDYGFGGEVEVVPDSVGRSVNFVVDGVALCMVGVLGVCVAAVVSFVVDGCLGVFGCAAVLAGVAFGPVGFLDEDGSDGCVGFDLYELGCVFGCGVVYFGVGWYAACSSGFWDSELSDAVFFGVFEVGGVAVGGDGEWVGVEAAVVACF